MIYKIADNILSPLGTTTRDNLRGVASGESRLAGHSGLWQLPEPVTASLFPAGERMDFELLATTSAARAIRESGVDVASPRALLILSSTKGDVERLTAATAADDTYGLAPCARRIAKRLGFTTEPIVVCNACVSGLSAIILAERLLRCGFYDYAVVCGAEVQSRFIVSGFQSLKAMSAQPCRPFDMERSGMNLGEAAATIVFACHRHTGSDWGIACGAANNDAFHISTPHRQGEGLRLALAAVGEATSPDSLAFVNAHGTATLFNDQMESVAMERAGLSAIPVVGLKGYYGHTMGASGVVETALCMAALDEGWIPATRGFQELGVSGKIRVTREALPTNKRSFVKTLSGFGGCNAAFLAVKGATDSGPQPQRDCWHMTHRVTLSPTGASVDGHRIATTSTGDALLRELYERRVGGYPKFHKMDPLCKLGFLATELLLQAEGEGRRKNCQDRAVVLMNRSSSVAADLDYLRSIRPESYFPSPSHFVYTLPNIVTGEIAIRNLYRGETAFYILPEKDANLMRQILTATACDSRTESIIGGWVDYRSGEDFEADIQLGVSY